MAMSNPAFSAKSFATPATAAAKMSTQVQPGLSADQLQEIYNRPSAGPAETDRMTYENTILKTVITLAFVVGGGVIGYNIPALMLPFALLGFVLALVNIFKKQPSPPLVLAYAVAQGIFVGGLSRVVEASAPGIIFQALIGTGIVFGVTLALFANGKVRASKKATKIFMIAGISYLIFSLFNVVTQLTGLNNDPWGLASTEVFGIPLGLIIGPLAILMGAYSLVLDFTSVKQGVDGGAPSRWGWKAAFGITLTIIWLYVEILRLISIIRGSN
ncbi:Bax inhibitor-1/YccA family protein [Salinibacterium sp. G-O1]|uniref:Bax inhibitor-1/YccA family protein n=1 Tax=Salinibacterium sp. G-O1 TaxID=3046208 RepID=UPI0024B890E8|nr:Bax inhibitor-1/YccA family protein [Salinibacterium sp. G-O1]MDJ0334217.1 Bax inhibitor-1/YccA family protein [Salinibacterium sp. G-O1]